MKFRVCESESIPDVWHVESMDENGEVYSVLFAGPFARERELGNTPTGNQISLLRDYAAINRNAGIPTTIDPANGAGKSLGLAFLSLLASDSLPS